MRPREAATGDLCVLLAPSRPLEDRVVGFLVELRERYGGRIVEPLHVTLDRIPAADEARIRGTVRGCASVLRPTPVRVNAIFGLASKSRGGVLKLDIPRDHELDGAIASVKAALRGAGAPSLYGPERWAAVTALERIARPPAGDPETLATPVELFVGDTLILSRIAGPARYEILDTATIASSG